MILKTLLTPVLVGGLLLASACGGKSDSTDGAASGSAAKAVAFDVTGNDTMKFSVSSLEASAGAAITVNFKNVGKLPKETMGHNFVVLKPGNEPLAFGMRAMNEGGNLENNHLPDAVKAEVLANTRILGPGEEQSITFTLPNPGVYPFVCTFPGHAAMMKGTITVK